MKTEYAHRLMFNGVLVFLIGLLSGFVLYVGAFKNGQVGVVAHLEGVMNGMFLMIVGGIWGRMALSERMQRLTCNIGVGSVWLNFGQAFWFGVMGRHRTSPVLPADRVPFFLETAIANVVLFLMSVGLITCCLLVLWGLRRGLAAERGPATLARHVPT